MSNDWKMETRIAGIAAPTAPVWAVFAAEEGDEEIWTARVHLWAQTVTELPKDEQALEGYLNQEVPPARHEIRAMVVCEGDLALTDETGWLFLGYAESESPPPENWVSVIERRRHQFALRMGKVAAG